MLYESVIIDIIKQKCIRNNKVLKIYILKDNYYLRMLKDISNFTCISLVI